MNATQARLAEVEAEIAKEPKAVLMGTVIRAVLPWVDPGEPALVNVVRERSKKRPVTFAWILSLLARHDRYYILRCIELEHLEVVS
jgi:hypothetical protein